MPVIDTDLFIQFLRGNSNAILYLNHLIDSEIKLFTTIYNIGELFKGVYESPNPAEVERQINIILENCIILFPTLESTKIWAQINTELKHKYGRQFLKDIGDVDQLIASIVIENKEKLITRNIHHFDKIRGLDILNWENSESQKNF